MVKLGARGFMRGHPIGFNEHTGQWLYSDTQTLADDSRPCPRCGRMPTPEGYDACIGYVPGAMSMCCGHGVEGNAIASYVGG